MTRYTDALKVKLNAINQLFIATIVLFGLIGCTSVDIAAKSTAINEMTWQTVNTKGNLVARHEAGLVGFNDKLYLLGGRRINPVNVFDTKTATWTTKSASPLEIHHFQPVVFENKIYIIGAMTGRYPGEVPLKNIMIYNPSTDTWSEGDEIPEHRRRGGAGVVVYNNKIYLVGGITDGHRTGTVSWFDEYDPKTGQWRVLKDMPNGRDHFQAAVVDNKLYAAGGRTTSQVTKQVFDLVVDELDIYDFNTHAWSTSRSPLPTPRAGNITTAIADQIWVIGGESMAHKLAHHETEIFDIKTQQWITGPSLNLGCHGTGVAIIDDHLWIASGSGNRGGSPELKNTEKLSLK